MPGVVTPTAPPNVWHGGEQWHCSPHPESTSPPGGGGVSVLSTPAELVVCSHRTGKGKGGGGQACEGAGVSVHAHRRNRTGTVASPTGGFQDRCAVLPQRAWAWAPAVFRGSSQQNWGDLRIRGVTDIQTAI